MALKIKVKEASPRKFRAKPSDRGAGGKWGPASNPDIGTMRKQSVQQWKESGMHDDLFQAELDKSLRKAGLPWAVCRADAYDEIVLMSALGNYGGGNAKLSKPVSANSSEYDLGLERLLYKIRREVADTYGVILEFRNEENLPNHPVVVYASLALEMQGFTRRAIIEQLMDAMKDVDAYLKKMAPAINREATRTFSESKTSKVCSMQKKIESLKKNKR